MSGPAQVWKKANHWQPARRMEGLAIVRETAATCGFRLHEMRSRRKFRTLTLARRRAAERLYLEEFSTPQIGALLNRHHTAVLYLLGHLGSQAAVDSGQGSGVGSQGS